MEKTQAAISKKLRYFFPTMAIFFFIVALFGFVPSYQDMYAGKFPIHWFAHVHGALMTGWLLLFITQTILVAIGRLRFHRQLGELSVVLAILVWISMGIVSFRVLIAENPKADSFLFDVLLAQFYSMLLFGLFFTWGMVVRKDQAAHKRLLYLSTLVLLQAAIDRISWLRNSIPPFAYLDAMLIPLYIYDVIVLKRIHKITWIGTIIYIITQATVLILWGLPAWHNFWFNLLNKFR